MQRRYLNFVLTLGPLVLALALEIAVFQLISQQQGLRDFASLQTAMNVLNQSAVYGVMAVGMTFVILTGGIDLSVGSLLAFAGVVCAFTVRAGGDMVLPFIALGTLAALASGAVIGGAAGALVAWIHVPPFIATLALMSSLRGLANLWTGGRPVGPLPAAYQTLGQGSLFGAVNYSILVFALVVLGGWALLEHTRFGRHVRAIGGNEESARLSGIPIARVKLWVYMLNGTLAALAGLLLSSRMGAGSPTVGVADELAVIAAVVVGGTSLSGGKGSITGTLMGLLVVATLNTGLTWIGVGTFGQQITLGLAILTAVLLDIGKRRFSA